MPIPRGTEVKFVGWTSDDTCALYKFGLTNSEYFDKYGLRVGDRGKVSDEYHIGRVNILWTLDTGIEIIVPMPTPKAQTLWHFKIVETSECSPIIALQARCYKLQEQCDKQSTHITELREPVNTLLTEREPCE